MEVHSLSCAGKILLFLFFCPNGISVFLCCFCLFEMIAKFFIRHISDIEWCPTIIHHMAHFLTFVTFDWWFPLLCAVHVHCIGIFLSWSIILMGCCRWSSWWLAPILVATLSIRVICWSRGIPLRRCACLTLQGFPHRSALVGLSIKGFFSLWDTPLSVNGNCLVIPFLNCYWFT